MSEAYERERQNNARLEELSSKVTALRGVTVDIYDNARAQDVIDNTVCHLFSPNPPRRGNTDKFHVYFVVANGDRLPPPYFSLIHSHP